MKRLLWTVTAAVAVSVISVSCSRTVTRIDPSEQVDISGRWNNTDARLTAERMIDQILGDKWVSNYQQAHNGQKPVVIVGFVTNKSTEHIEAETFLKDVEQSFIRSGKVRLVQGGKKREELRAERADQQTNSTASSMKKFGLEQGADFILQGSINQIVDAHKKKKVSYFQVNLELTDMQSNEIVWIGDEKISKYIKN